MPVPTFSLLIAATNYYRLYKLQTGQISWTTCRAAGGNKRFPEDLFRHSQNEEQTKRDTCMTRRVRKASEGRFELMYLI
jgi:hypothetical protein